MLILTHSKYKGDMHFQHQCVICKICNIFGCFIQEFSKDLEFRLTCNSSYPMNKVGKEKKKENVWVFGVGTTGTFD